jgi:hypothetical protein
MNDLDAKFFAIKAATIPVVVLHELSVTAEVRAGELVYTFRVYADREGLRTIGYIGKGDWQPYLFVESIDPTKPLRIDYASGSIFMLLTPGNVISRRLAVPLEHTKLPVRFENEYHIVGSYKYA